MTMMFSKWEFLLYTLCTIIPWVLLSLFTFKENFRHSLKMTCICTVLLTITRAALDLSILYVPKEWYFFEDLAGGLLYLLFTVLLVDMHIGKIAFFLLAISSFSNWYVIAAKHVEGLISLDWAYMRYHWTYAVCMLILEILLLPLLYRLFCVPFISVSKDNDFNRMWYYLWLVPLTFFMIWVVLFYGSTTTSLVRSIGKTYWLVKLAIDAGSLLIYRLLFMLIAEHKRAAEMAARNYEQDMRITQYTNLSEKIDSMRELRHNIRHHLQVIDGYAQQDGDKELTDYVEKLMDNTALKKPLLYCENLSANAVLQYYAGTAQQEDIPCSIAVTMPKDIFIEPTDISVLIGSLFSNAVEACIRDRQNHPDIADKQYIVVKGRPKSDSIYTFYIENKAVDKPVSGPKGAFLSHHHAGTGIGLASVKHIAKKYNGTASISFKDEKFTAAVMLIRQ